jgi:hypothetical protein
MILILAINIVTVYAYIFTKSKGRSPVFFETVIHFLEINNPFLHPEAALYFSIACFGAALLTVYAYNKRKSYLE